MAILDNKELLFISSIMALGHVSYKSYKDQQKTKDIRVSGHVDLSVSNSHAKDLPTVSGASD